MASANLEEKVNLKKYIAELKKRNVIKAGIAYLIVAWIIAEVASVILPTFNAPVFFMKTLLIILIIGFPVNLVFAWIYDITRDGIKKTDDIDQKSQKLKLTGNRLNRVIIVSLSLVVVLLVYNQFRNTQSKKEGKVHNNSIAETAIEDKKSIAVLPFANFSNDPDLEHFCDGMTDEVISRLSKVSSLGKVIPRTSVFKYKGSEKSILEIANELGVTHILESGVQKDGEKIKIVLKLIDATTNDPIWTDDYFDVLKDIFEIQATVAEIVAGKLDAKITNDEIKSIRKIPTSNEEAYELFLQAEFQRHKNDRVAYENAKLFYEKAIELDPDFTEAYLGLGLIWINGGLIWGIYDEQEAWKNGRTLYQKALELESTNVEALDLLNSGYFYYEWDFERVDKYYLAILQQAIHDNYPAEVDYFMKTGRYHEALERVEKRIQFDPTFGVIYSFKAIVLTLSGKRDEARDLLVSNDPLYSNDWWYLREAAITYFYLGEYEKSRSHLNLLMTNLDERPPILLWLNAVHYHMEGKHKEADRYFAMLKDKYQDNTSGSPAWFLALYYCTIEDYDKAFMWLEKSFKRHEVELTWVREELLLVPVRDDPRYKDLYERIGFPERL